MKRMHIHVSVDDLERSVRFYKALFAAEPVTRKPDYAKWMLEDPRVNFSISQRGAAAGLDHLGIQVDSQEELERVRECLTRADGPVLDEGDVTCCYARSRKSWIEDPSGISWEAFLSLGESAVYADGKSRENVPVAHSAESTRGAPQAAASPQAPAKSCC